MNYNLIVIGSGPGGYVAAIRASQLGMKVAVVERSELGGICLNWGCIPTKSLLKSAEVYNYLKHAENYGIKAGKGFAPDFSAIVERSRGVAAKMNKGIEYLFKKNKIDVLVGTGKLLENKKVEVLSAEGKTEVYGAENIILATGARSRVLPNLPIDGKKIIGYRKAMTLDKQPESMLVVGSGAIGSEFAFFYNSIGTKVTLVEYLPNILPLEDIDVSKQVGRSFKKAKMKVMVSSMVEKVDTSGEKCLISVKTKKGIEEIEADIVLSAVGITPNLENIGIEELGIELENGKIKVDSFYKTNIDGVYAIGDIVHGQELAHVASAEGIVCVEKMVGQTPQPIDYTNVPANTYTTPEVASVGMTELAAKEAGFELRIGKFPFTASGKASAAGNNDGFVKLIFDEKTDLLLGAHLVGQNVTEMISELVLARKKGATAKEILSTIHPHPTMSEAVMEAAAAAHGEVIHL